METKISNRLIRRFKPCYDPFVIVKDEEEELPVKEWVNKYGTSAPAKDIIWLLLRKEFMSDRDMRFFAVWCARESLKLVKSPDIRSIEACNIAEKFANGEADGEELSAARAAAADADARAAAYAADADARAAATYAAAYAAAAADAAAADADAYAAAAAADARADAYAAATYAAADAAAADAYAAAADADAAAAAAYAAYAYADAAADAYAAADAAAAAAAYDAAYAAAYDAAAENQLTKLLTYL